MVVCMLRVAGMAPQATFMDVNEGITLPACHPRWLAQLAHVAI